MSENRNKHFIYGALSALILLILFILDISTGSVYISFGQVLEALASRDEASSTVNKIIFQIRLPKALTAMLAGSALAISGFQLQTIFRNPLAGPSILGISSGASLGVALLTFGGGGGTVLWLSSYVESNAWLMIIASTLGAFLVLSIILIISLKVTDNVAMLIIGIMIGNVTLSITSIWQYFSSPDQVKDFLLWTFGSFSGVTISKLPSMTICILAGSLLSFLSANMLNVMQLGDKYAQSMGVRIRTARTFVIFLSSLLAGTVTAFCGPIGFIGIAVPHITRILFRSTDLRMLLPFAAIIGASIALFCDILAQIPGMQYTLPINAITALIGSPIVIWVILSRRNLKMTV